MKSINNNKSLDVVGQGGGGKSARIPYEGPNTLQSNALAKVLFVYSVGQTGGLRNGAKSIFIDGTQLQNDDGTYNFEGVEWSERTGEPDQDYIPGFSQAESLQQVNTQIKKDVAVIRDFTEPNIDAVKAIIGIPALRKVESNGDQKGTTVTIKFEVQRIVDGVWEDRGTQVIDGKNTSPTELQYRIEKPSTGSGGWRLRVSRLTDDSTTQNLSNSTFLNSIVLITDLKTNYAGCALVALKFDTSLFGNSIPTISFDVIGVKVPVPSNYNPVTRNYVGTWDGNFVYKATSNPAWHVYNILTDSDYGAKIPAEYIDKWEFYTMARYCDGVDVVGDNANFVGLPDGKGGSRPRFTLRTQITTQEDAIQWVRTICSSMHAMPYWGAGVVQLAQDRPKNPTLIANASTVEGGKFLYSSTEYRHRTTVVNVTWNDPANFFKPAVATYTASAADIARYGRNVLDLTKFGCTSESEALAEGAYHVKTALKENSTLTYRAGMDHAGARPGDIVKVFDPSFAGTQMDGRIRSATTTTVTLDRPVTLNPGNLYTITVVDVDGVSLVTKVVTNPAGTHQVINVGEPFANVPPAQHPFIVAGDDIQPRLFRIMSVKESNGNSFDVTALYYDPQKFAEIEGGIDIPDPIFTRIKEQKVNPGGPINFEVASSIDPIKGPQNNLVASWAASDSPYATAYRVLYRTNNENYKSLGTIGVSSITIPDIKPGIHNVIVYAISVVSGRESPPVVGTYEFAYGGQSALLKPQNLAVKGGGLEFTGRDCTVTWTENTGNIAAQATTLGYQVTILDPDTLAILHQENVPFGTNEYMYSFAQNTADGGPRRRFRVEVRNVDTQNRLSEEASIIVANPAPALPTGVRLAGNFRNYDLRYDLPTVSDWDGIIVWSSETAGFTPNATNLAYAGRNTLVVVPGEAGKTYYVRYALYDVFGQDGLNVSGEQVVTTVRIDHADQIGQIIEDGNLTVALSERINLIDAPGTGLVDRVGGLVDDIQDLETQVTTEVSTRQTQYDALSSRIDTVAAKTGAQTFRQNSAPTTGMTAGDLWFDTDDSNKAYRYNGTVWQATDDTRIAANLAAIQTETTARTDADTALANQITTVTAKADRSKTYRQNDAPTSGMMAGDLWFDTDDNNKAYRYNGSTWDATDDTRISTALVAVQTETTARADADTALGQRIDTIVAQGDVGFNAGIAWHFDTSADGWSALNGALTWQANGTLRFTHTTSDGYAQSPSSLTINGAANRYVKARITRVAGSTWDGTVYYQTAGHTFSSSYNKKISNPNLAIGDSAVLTWDMHALTVGGTDWKDNTIVRIRLDLNSSASDIFEIDWIAVGSEAPAVGTAALQAESKARVDAIAAEASARSELAARVSTAEGEIASASAAIANEQTARANADSALTSSLSTLQTTVNGQTTSISTQTSSINGIQAKHTVKIDNNGYVSGYGLISTANNGTPTSDFIVSADRFSIAKPGTGGLSPTVPFIVSTKGSTPILSFNGYAKIDNLLTGTLDTETLYVGGTGLVLDGPNKNLRVNNGTRDLVKLGQISPGVYGIEIRDTSGNLVMSSAGGLSNIPASKVTGLGGLATLDAVGSSQIAAGQGVNMIYNSDLAINLDGWSAHNNNTGQTITVVRNANAATTLTGAGSVAWFVPSTVANGLVFDVKNVQANGRYYPVQAGVRYEASAYLGQFRSGGVQIGLTFLNASGTSLGEFYGAKVSNTTTLQNLSQYGRSVVFATAPTGAVSAVLSARVTGNGGSNPYGVLTRAYLGQAGANQTEASPWSPGVSTINAAGVGGLGTLATANSVTTAQVSGLGTLATQNTVTAGQVTGLGSLATASTVPVNLVTGLGSFATQSQITQANASTYIANAALNSAHIGSLTADKLYSGVMRTDTFIQAGNNVIMSGGDGGRIYIQDPRNGKLRAYMGHMGGVDYGFWLWDYNGTEIFGSSGLTGTFIKDATVGTLKIAGNAVTVPVSTTIAGDRQGNGAYATIMSMNVPMQQAGWLLASVSLGHSYSSLTGFDMQLYIDGTLITTRHAGNGSYNEAPSMIGSAYVGAGPHTVSVNWKGNSGAIILDGGAMFAIGAMR
ncbi:TipJ family phage tail tip protein [Escherichia coli]|uniref:TipJ family phage tail tip protein n=1 Tax=Escherichia coli TaxID=562 RepID=UPI000E20D3C4|nr:phage tail protein [Escherichia coli]